MEMTIKQEIGWLGRAMKALSKVSRTSREYAIDKLACDLMDEDDSWQLRTANLVIEKRMRRRQPTKG
jgi:hypothetical protein